MPEENIHPIKRHGRAIAVGLAAAILLMGVSAFALAPRGQSANSAEPARMIAAANPVARSTPPRRAT